MSHITRRELLRHGALAATLLPFASPRLALAQEPFPNRAIKWVVPYLAGTGPDTTTRILADAVAPFLGQPVIIDNRAGAAGNIGARVVAKAAPDGYTWFYSAAPMAANMHMYKNPGFDALKDFRHIMRLTSSDIVVVVTLLAAVALFAVILSSHKIDATERSRVQSFIPMFIASAVFWSLFQQQFTVVAVYADQRLDLSIGAWTMPPSWVQAINPIFIIIFAGIFAAMWTKLGPRQPRTPVKFALGTIFMGIAFLLFLPYAGGGPNRVRPPSSRGERYILGRRRPRLPPPGSAPIFEPR